jgi:hypothetical protein
VNAVNGVATFSNVGISGGAASYTLTFAANGLTSATQTITLVAGAATMLLVSTNPAGATNGSAFTTQPIVALRDSENNSTGSTAAVTMTVSSGGLVTGTATVNAVNGTATFTDVGLNGPVGQYTLTFSAAGLSSATRTIQLGVGVAHKLGVITSPSATAVYATPFATQPRVAVQDVGGNIVTSSTLAVTAFRASTTDVNGALTGTTTVNAANGIASFSNLALSLPGLYTIGFSAPGVDNANSSGVTVTSGVPSKLTISQPAAQAASGTAFGTQPIVRIEDAAGYLTSSNALVTMSFVSGPTIIGGASVNAVNGTATFTTSGLSGTAGTYTLRFTSPGLTTATQEITLTGGTPTKLTIETTPAGAVTETPFTTQPVIRIADTQGNRTSATRTVTAAISTGAGTLSGTKTVTSVDGLATFSDLALTPAGDYRLTFTSSGLTSVTTGTFTVTPKPLVITTTSFPATNRGVAFSHQLLADGGTGFRSWSVEVGSALPAGVSLSTTGVLSGTITTAGTYEFTVRVVSGGVPAATAVVTLRILNPALVIGTTAITPAYRNTAYGFTMAGSGGTGNLGDYRWRLAAGTLPAGLSLSTGGGITGTPSSSTETAVTIELTDGEQTVQRTFNVGVYESLVLTSVDFGPRYCGEPMSVQLQSTGGAPGTKVWSAASAMPTGLTLSSTGLVSGTPGVNSCGSAVFSATISARVTDGTMTTTKSLTITYVKRPYWDPGSLAPSVNLTCPVVIAQEGIGCTNDNFFIYRSRWLYPQYPVTATPQGALPTGWTNENSQLYDSLGATVYRVIVNDNRNFPMGCYSWSNAYRDADGNTATYVVQYERGAVVLNTSALPDAALNQAYSAPLAATSPCGTGGLTFTVTGLPAGLIFNSSLARITGTATAAGSYTVTVTAGKGNLTSETKTFTLWVR